MTNLAGISFELSPPQTEVGESTISIRSTKPRFDLEKRMHGFTEASKDSKKARHRESIEETKFCNDSGPISDTGQKSDGVHSKPSQAHTHTAVCRV